MKKKEIVRELRAIRADIVKEICLGRLVGNIARDTAAAYKKEIEEKGRGDEETSRMAAEVVEEAARNEAVMHALETIALQIDRRILSKCEEVTK